MAGHTMKIVVAICTRNPRLDILTEVLESLGKQTETSFKTLLINNGGDERPLLRLQKEFAFDLLFESRIGNSWARFRALSVSEADLLVFVDDDNVLAPNYIEAAAALTLNNPTWGVFGGKQIRHPELRVSKNKEFILPYLAIRDLGPTDLTQKAELRWIPVEPVGAGMCITKAVITTFLNSPNLDDYFLLGRKGKRLLSGEDSFIARQATFTGLDYGYSPSLELTHRINTNRLSSSYLAKLMFGYGISDVRLERALGVAENNFPRDLKMAVLHFLFNFKKGKYGYLLGLRSLGQYWGARNE